MKKLICLLSLVVASVLAQAQVFPSGFFPAVPPFIDGFDGIPAGLYTSFPMFGGNGVAARTTATGALVVGNAGGLALTAPNYLTPTNTNVTIKMVTPKTAFGGFFMLAPGSIGPVSIRFQFFDPLGLPIGSVVVPCPAAWSWIGWTTMPNWQRVEIDAITTSTAGAIAMDEFRVA
ncbi:MAG TPA: hypothetical protein VHE55_01950 [Fimbriimonadaceae bacterium]|nr:hypothetical protein [Fimbriimonadaceae bacterium]